MGGSQIWLEEGEQMTVHELLKAIVIVSANDCTVALAERVAGSESAFVDMMNARAAELGMEDTHFVNCTGLDADGHVTSAYDIALMARALISHDMIKDYTTIWMDTLRDGKSRLDNTNKLLKSYSGTTGLKTGSTSVALYCLAATAERDGMELIAAIMAAPTSDIRFDTARQMLDYGFANYALVKVYPDNPLLPIPVTMGALPEVQPLLERDPQLLIKRTYLNALERSVDLPEVLDAPVAAGQQIGTYTVTCPEGEVAVIPIVANEDVARLSLWDIFKLVTAALFMN